jgi:phosphomannomutase/phosphoglucomutase
LEGGDDGLFSALLVCSLMAAIGKPVSDLLSDIPRYPSTPEVRIKYSGEKGGVIENAIAHAKRQGARVTLVDGVKAEYDEGWALIRASVTEPAFTFRFEGDTPSAMLNVAEGFLSGLGEIGARAWKQVEFYVKKPERPTR